MKKESLWIQDLNIDNVHILNEDIDIDVLIIGGGITGITSAYCLKNTNKKICLVEQGYVGMGVTSKTTGKINYLQETIYSDICKKYSLEVAKKYLFSQKFAINKIIEIIEKEKIDCNLDKVSSYVFTNDNSKIDDIKKEKIILERLGINIKEYNDDKIIDNLNYKYAISVEDTYIFHPLKYIYALKKILKRCGINIFEQTRVIEMKKIDKGYLCLTNTNKIIAKKVILACHYPFFLNPYMIPLKVYTERSYIVAARVDEYKKETFITSNLPVKSIRFHNDKRGYILYLSNSHNICNKMNYLNNFSKIINEVKLFNLKLEYVWSNDDIMTVDKIPYIGRLEKNNDSLFLGTGFNTWGMTNGTLAGYMLSDMVLGKKNEFEAIFDPLRVKFLENLSGYFFNMGSNFKSIVQNKLFKNKYWYSDKVHFEIRNGRNIAIYDDGKKEHTVYTNCPHLGCTLLFNEVEKTWDCPCHASKFNLDGKCIKGPSTFDISYKE